MDANNIEETAPANVASSLAIPLGRQIKIARAELGITQEDLAREAGVPQPSLSRWESGASNPRGDSFTKCMSAIARLGGSVALDAANGVLGVFGRTGGALEIVDLDADPEPIDSLASVHGSPFIARGYTTMIAGEGGAGKSFLCQTIAAGLVEGKTNAAGMTLPGKSQRVLYLDAENGKNLVLQRAKTNLGITKDNYRNYSVAVVAKGRGFDLKRDMDAFRAIVKEAHDAGEGYDLVVLDSMVSIWSGSENSVNDVTDLFYALDGIASLYGCAILVIHHTGKDGEYRGSSSIQGAVTCGLYEFTKVGGDGSTERKLHCAKNRIAREPQDLTQYVTGRGVIAGDDMDES